MNLYTMSSVYISAALDSHAPIVDVSTNQGGTREFAFDGSAGYKHFRAFAMDKFSTDTLVCPKDSRHPAASYKRLSNDNLSYFLAINNGALDQLQPIMGDRHVRATSGIHVLSTEGVVRWQPNLGLHGAFGYIAFSDAHVEARTNVADASVFGAEDLERLIIVVP